MKILCGKSPNLSYCTMQGWSDALTNIGFEFIFWDSKTKPIFDAFDENEPDIFISTVGDISRGVAKCLKQYPDTISLFYSPKFELVFPEDIEYMEKLFNDTGKPDYIFSFCHESRLDDILGEWGNKGYKTLSIMKAANTKIYYPRLPNPLWSTDIAFISDYYNYLNPYILPLCRNNKTKIRIFGDGWPIPQGIGRPLDENISNIYTSSKIILDINNNDYEPSDTPFNVIASGGLCISNSVKNILNSIPNFETPEELHTIIDNYKFIPHQAIPIEEHTYNHRMNSLLKTIGLK